MYPDQLVSGQLIQIYTVFKTSYTQVQDGMGHFTLFTGHHISLIFIFIVPSLSLSESQTVWIQIKSDILSVLIWF